MALRAFIGVLAFVSACAGTPPEPETASPATAPSATAPASFEPESPTDAAIEPGAREQVRELQKADENTNVAERFHKKTEIFRAIRQLADPRGADALDGWATATPASGISKGEHLHFRTLAAFALAELGDVRAIPILGERLALDPLESYDDSAEQQVLRRDDQERVISARLLADLGSLHPEIARDARDAAARGISAWLKDKPEPHANGMRARARLHIDAAATHEELVGWADPKTPLPKKGAQPPFPSEFVVAQSALRYLGASRHPKATAVLKKQLKRRPKGFDGRMDGLMLQGNALLGMTLRALASGAAQGFAELGDPKATPLLLAYVDDDLENEQSRIDACQALAWLAGDSDSAELSKRLKSWSAKPQKDDQFRLACLLDGLVLRMPDALTPSLLTLVLDPQSDPLVAIRAAKALGRHGLDAPTESALLAQLDGPRSPEAAVAIALGGSSGALTELVKRANGAKGSWLPSVTSAYTEAVNTFYANDLDSGSFFRWIENAAALATAKVDFAADALRQRYTESEFDDGPKSLTRVVLRGRLYSVARGDGREAKRALLALELLRERGVLLALAEKDGPNSTEARAALRRVPMPK